MTDPVNHPAHYTEHPSGIECIQITEHMGFNLGNAVKYIWRADLKGSAIEDLEKARWYIDRELTKRDHIDAEVVGADVPDFAPGGVVIPEGGRVLTAEQVEDVRALVWLDGRRNFDAFHRLRALFPATEPAEDAKPCGSNSVTLGWCKLTARHEGLHTNGTYLWGTPSEPDPPAPSEPAEERCQSVSIFRERCALVPGHDGRHAANGCAWGYPPAPAEPAEEETKAEDYCCHPMCRHTNWGGSNRKHTRGSDCPIVPKPTSSPVVPAPTETGPWQTWQEVLEGVWYQSGRDRVARAVWMNIAGIRYIQVPSDGVAKPCVITSDYMVNYAPFVAAEEG